MSAVQVCTGVMLHGYPLVKQLCGELQVSNASHRMSHCCYTFPMGLQLVSYSSHLGRLVS